jgi:Helix-turn-helix domain
MTCMTHTAQHVADLIPLRSERWLIERARAGEFPGHKIGRSWRFTDEDIAAILVICGNGSPGIGGAAEGLPPRSSNPVSA